MIAAESTNNTKTPRISLRNKRSDRLFRFNHPMCKEVHLMIASTSLRASSFISVADQFATTMTRRVF